VDRRAQLTAGEAFPLPDDPHDVADFVRALRAVKVWAGDPSLEVIRRRTGVAASTLSDAFDPRRRRLPSLDLVRAIVRACGAVPSEIAAWESVWRLLRERTNSAPGSAPNTPSSPGRRSELRRNPGSDPDRDPRTSGGAVSPGQHGLVPRQLPPDAFGFVGRGEALAALAERSDQGPTTVITGTAGVGKTALAVHWAHQIAEQFPDGQLYLDLRGHAGGPATTPAEALSFLLRSLGVPDERIPVDLHLQMGLYRSVLAGRKVLVVLDNIVDAAHARPLLPSGPRCQALITSRDALTGLVVREGAVRITLDTLTPAESAELLATHLGPERVTAEPDATADLAVLCAHLPLALRITAANLAARPNRTIAETVHELGRTDLLGHLHVVGDPASAVSAAFDMSYRSLPEPAQQLFRLLGLVPGPEVDRATAAILLGRAPLLELDELMSAHMLFEPTSGRYRMHDLLSLYARRQATAEPEAVRAATKHRLLSWYLLNADEAARTMTLADTLEDRTELTLTGVPPGFSGPSEALAWLDTELPNLAKAVTHVAEHGPAPFAWHLLNSLHVYLCTRALGVQHLAIAGTALRAAEANGNVMAQGMCHESLAVLMGSVGDLEATMVELESSLRCFTEVQHAVGVRTAVGLLGDTWLRLGDINRAVDYFEQALDPQPTITRMNYLPLANLAIARKIGGNHAEALRVGSEGLALAEQTGSIRLAGVAKLILAMAHLDLGDPASAEPLFLEVRAIAIEFGREIDAIDALAGLVLCCVRTGRTGEALTWMAPLCDLVDRGVYSYTGDDWAHTAILEAHLAAGLLEEALAIGAPALEEYDRSGHRLTAMRVRIVIGGIHAAQGNDQTARRHWESALLYTAEQSLPDGAVIERLLADLT
jgi:tetratricopeptide (TPR) repeat protein